MGQFKFRLQKLLDIRIDNEEQSKIEFKKAQDEKLLSEEKMETLKDSYEKYGDLRKNGTVVQQKITQAYLNSLSQCIYETKDNIKKQEMILEKRRYELKQKQVERKTVEILKDKQKAKFDKEQKEIEQKANDEFALYGFIRNIERR